MRGTEVSAPRARTGHVVVKAVAGELLVYDLERHHAHSLNVTAAAVWRRCDGRRSLADIVRLVAGDVGSAVDEVLVRQALGQLDKARLLEERGTWVARLTRREALRASLVTAAALPLVTTIIVPRSLHAQSSCVLMSVSLCTGPFDCGSNIRCRSGETCCFVEGGGTCCSSLPD
jgi:Coenzyme PQQ synthesis protein D (PqqD)